MNYILRLMSCLLTRNFFRFFRISQLKKIKNHYLLAFCLCKNDPCIYIIDTMHEPLY